jgi:hypothetical protein
MRWIVLFSLLGGVALASDAAPVADAKTLVKNLVAVTAGGPPEGETRLRLLLQQCSELASCAGSCARELHAAADTTDEAQRGTILSQCFPDLKKAHKESGATVDGWFTKRFSSYVARVRAVLAAGDQKALDRAAAALKLGK